MCQELRDHGDKRVPVQQVTHADAHTAGLVHIGRANPSAGGANGCLASGFLFQSVKDNVVGHDNVGAFTDEQPGCINSPQSNLSQFTDQNIGVYYYAITYDSIGIWPTDS